MEKTLSPESIILYFIPPNVHVHLVHSYSSLIITSRVSTLYSHTCFNFSPGIFSWCPMLQCSSFALQKSNKCRPKAKLTLVWRAHNAANGMRACARKWIKSGWNAAVPKDAAKRPDGNYPKRICVGRLYEVMVCWCPYNHKMPSH